MATMDLTNEVIRLRAELEKVSTERDMLLCEVSNLRRELELSDLKNLNDDRGACLVGPWRRSARHKRSEGLARVLPFG
ncbi:unnamed protein product [Plutella xylostella]|uniref:(diamondback moth) hypothetical protein n=1 Tax=Plutella xylostella TaxID=51655 RepID=A0A8S4E2W5_PLUXY|nr:unnamed protein product [Plutella xylostella]